MIKGLNDPYQTMIWIGSLQIELGEGVQVVEGV